MISRLTISALAFAVLGAATLTFAAGVQQQQVRMARHDVAQTAPAGVIHLPAVEVIGHRSALNR